MPNGISLLTCRARQQPGRVSDEQAVSQPLPSMVHSPSFPPRAAHGAGWQNSDHLHQPCKILEQDRGHRMMFACARETGALVQHLITCCSPDLQPWSLRAQTLGWVMLEKKKSFPHCPRDSPSASLHLTAKLCKATATDTSSGQTQGSTELPSATGLTPGHLQCRGHCAQGHP